MAYQCKAILRLPQVVKAKPSLLTRLGIISTTGFILGYTSLNLIATSPPSSNNSGNSSNGGITSSSEKGPSSSQIPPILTEDEDKEFWSLMKDPTVSELKLNRVIRKMQQQDELSLGSSGGGALSMNSEFSPRGAVASMGNVYGIGPGSHSEQDVDYTITSLGKEKLIHELH